jgi:hypothetical protein
MNECYTLFSKKETEISRLSCQQFDMNYNLKLMKNFGTGKSAALQPENHMD